MREKEAFSDAELGIDDETGATAFRVLLDDVTVARLLELSETCHARPATVISAIVRDVLEDDAFEHEMLIARDCVTVQ